MKVTTAEGFRVNAGGLYVPAEQSRERTVYTNDEWRVLERATKLLSSMGIQLFLRCNEPKCQKDKIERIRNLDGGITFRCNHRDRVFPRHL